MQESGTRELFNILAAHINEAVLVWGPEGRLVFVNGAGLNLFGRREADMRLLAPAELLQPPPPSPDPGVSVAAYVHPRTPTGNAPMVEGQIYGLDGGKVLWVLRPSLPLAEVGALTAGLVHNLSGPLSVIRSTAELARRVYSRLVEENPELADLSDGLPPTLKKGLTRIIDQVDQISSSASDLLAKIRGESTMHEGLLDLNAILAREVKFLENDLKFKHSVETRLELDPDLPPVRGLYSDFSHSFRNIIRNAVQAMEDSPDRILTVESELTGDQARIAVSDTGCGIPEEIRESIFQPFFTTRNATPGGGTGLGLHSVRQLLAPYNVRFQVESRPGCTVFTLMIPLFREAARD